MATTYRTPSRWRARLLIVASLYFTFLGGTFITDLSFWPRVLHHVLVSAILAGWIISLWRRRAGIPTTPLNLPMAAVLVSWIIATVFAVDPRVSAESLWQIGVLVAFFFILVDLIRSWGARTVLEPVFFCAGVVVVMALFEFVSWYFGFSWWLPLAHQSWPAIGGLSQPIPPTIYRLQYTLSVATFLAGYLSLLMPVALAWAITSVSPTVRRGLAMWLAGAAVTMLLAFSRGGILSLGVSILVFAALIVLGSESGRARALSLLRDWRVWAGVVAIVAVLGVIIAAGLRGDPFGHAAGDRERFNLFQGALNIGLGRPISGVGPYGFGRAFRPYRDPAVTGDQFTSAHDIPLQVFAEAGLIGLAALAWLVFSIGRLALGRWRSASGAERVRIAGIIAGLAGFAGQNLGDTLVNIPVFLPLLALCAYLVAPIQPEQSRIGSRARRAILAAASLTVVMSIAGWAVSDLAQLHFERSVQAGQRADFQTALREIELAIRIDPSMGYYAAQRAQYLGVLASFDKASLPAALDAYNRALRFENSYALMRFNHALLLRENGDLAGASSEIHAAATLQPGDPRYTLEIAELDEEMGQSSDALTNYQAALNMAPGWVNSSYWDKSDLRRQARDVFVRATGTSWSPAQLASVDAGCRAAGAAGRSASMPADPMCQGEIALRILDNPAAALPWLDQAVARDKASPAGYLLRAETQRRLGNAPLAEKDARIALFLGDVHAYVILGRLAESAGRAAEAEHDYQSDPPAIIQSQGWDVAIYERRGALAPLPLFDGPGLSRYDFEAWFALLDLYNRQGRAADVSALRSAILRVDPTMTF